MDHKVNMNREEIIDYYIKEARKHNLDEIECYIAGWREDTHKDYFTWGEVLDSLITQKGWVWENHTKKSIEIMLKHPEIFNKKNN